MVAVNINVEVTAAKGALDVYDKCVARQPVGHRVRRFSRRLGD